MAVRWRAPGRVNLIGEHTDYNAGFVLPFAIAAGCTATVAVGTESGVRVDSVQQPDSARHFAPDELRPGTGEWAGYPLGVVWALQQRGFELPGLSVTVDSDVPVGAGLSSSAALVCATATALADLLDLGLGTDALLAVTRSAENDFVGAPTGGMDQLAALRCTTGHALFCDMRSLHTEPVALTMSGLQLLVVDTRAEHRHADGEYRRRREGCDQVARLLGVPALRDVGFDELDSALARLDDDELRRYTRHVVTENDRVLRAVAALRADDPVQVGALMDASHVSMREDFRITIPELDMAAETLLAAGALGARMTGGGFGGSVIALVPEKLVEPAAAAVLEAFAARGFTRPGWFVATPSQGAHKVE